MTGHQIPPMAMTGPPGLNPHRRLSKMSNLMWTSSVSQPDLTMSTSTTTMSPTSLMSPSTSQPTTRASSPGPPSVSARGTPGPSPFISPLGSGSIYYQDLSYLSQALSQLGVSQNYVFPTPYQQVAEQRPDSRQHQNIHDLNGNDPGGQFLIARQAGEGVPMLRQHNNTPSALKPTDPNQWYTQYVSMPPGLPSESRPETPHELRGQSCSPQRSVNLSSQQSSTSKPCAVITPQLVTKQNKGSDSSVEAIAQSEAQLTLLSPAVGQESFWTQEANSAGTSEVSGLDPSLPPHLNQKVNSGDATAKFCPPNSQGSYPDIQFAKSTASVGTSCSDLTATEASPPFVLETCQICNVFHGPGPSTEDCHQNSQYFTFKPCVYGLQVVGQGGASVRLQDGTRCRYASCETANQSDNARKYEANYKFQSNLQTGTQVATKGSCAMEQLKR